ncbi:hypothetical protein EDD85DRAFT_952777 [Armillaria nabsnona]|nr:hypothetical protein EDD85DRAFT_952777 [Armillaria nabsnona]
MPDAMPTASPQIASVTNPPLPSLPSTSTLISLPSSASLDNQTLACTPSPVPQATAPQTPISQRNIMPVPSPRPAPSPKALISDNSSSDIFSSSLICMNISLPMSSADQPAQVQSHGGQAPSTLGCGHLWDPEMMSHYADIGIAYVCRQTQKNVTLPDILSNFVDRLSDNLAVMTWFKQNELHLIQLSFRDFMAAFRDRFLPTTWKKDLTNEIWQEIMTSGIIFIDWIKNLCGRNGLLAGYTEFIADNVFLSNLCGHISKPLQDAICNIPKICECNNLDVWMKLVTVQDNKLHHKCKELEDIVEAMMVACNKCPNLITTMSNMTPAPTIPTAVATENTQPARNNYYFPPHHMNSAPPSASGSLNTPFTYKYQSCLEDNECATLTANDGCFTYCDINMLKEEQGFNKCKGRPPPAAGYEWCTPEWVICQRADKAKGISFFTIAIVTSNASLSTQSQAPAASAPAPAPAPTPATAIQFLATMAWPIAAAVPANESGVLNATNVDGTVLMPTCQLTLTL